MSLEPKKQTVLERVKAIFAVSGRTFVPCPGHVVEVTAIGEYSAQQNGVGVVGEVIDVEVSRAFPGWLSLVIRRPNGRDWVSVQCRVQLARARAGRAA